MKKILNCFHRLLNQYNKQNKNPEIQSSKQELLPSDISDIEKIARFIFSPININPKSGKLKSNLYKPPTGSDEISVNRLDYTNADFLKNLALPMQQSGSQRNYFGFGVINTIDIRNSDAEVIYTPIIDSNIFHSDIKIGHIVQAGQELPSEINNKIQKLVKATRTFKDLKPESNSWEGENLE